MRRITIARLKPRIPAAVTYAQLNSSDAGSDVVLSGGNLTASRSTGSGNAAVRLDLGLTIGAWYWETRATAFTGTNGGTRAGIMRSGAALSGMGTDLVGIAGPNPAGDWAYNSAAAATGFTLTNADTVGHWFDTSTGTYRVRKNGGSWVTLIDIAYLDANSLDPIQGFPWYPTLQLNALSSMLIRVDPSTFVYDPPTGARAGLYLENDPVATDVYISSDPHVANAPVLLPRIAGTGSDLVIERHARLWPWDSTGTDRRGRLAVLNGDRALDAWDGYGWRDAEFEILAGNEGDDFSAFETWSSGVVESFGWDDNRNLVIELADPLARLDSPMQPVMYPEGGNNESIVGAPLPISLGVVSIFPTLLSTLTAGGTENTYQVHDGPVFGINPVRDRGDDLAYVTDWDYLPGRTGFQLVNAPDNPVSAVVQGGFEIVDYAVPRSGVTDDFAAAGWSGSPLAPQGWTNTSASGGTVTQVASSGARFLASSGGGQIARLSVTVPTGAYYYVTVVVNAWTSGDLNLEADPGVGDIIPLGTTGTGTYSAFVLISGNFVLRNISGSAIDLRVQTVTATEVELIDRLPAWLREICVTRGGFDLADVDIAAAESLDEKSNFYRLGWFGNQATSKLALLRMALDSFTGWITSTRAGLITVGRLEADGSEPVAFALDDTNIQKIRSRKDVGRNFTRQMAGERSYAVHSDGDLATSLTIEERAVLMTEWGAIREADAPQESPDSIPTGASVTSAPEASEAYQSAIGAEPQPTLLTNAYDVRAESNRVSSILDAATLRWWEVTALLDSRIADSIEIGQRVTITMPIDGLSDGVDATILGAQIWVNSNRVVLNLLQYPDES